MKRVDYIFVCVILILFFVAVLLIQNNATHKKKLLNKNFRYTLCVTTGKVKNIRSSGPDLLYEFRVGKSYFKGNQRFIDSGNINYEGGKYFVKYQLEDPSNNLILLDYPLPNVTLVAPDSGWTTIPN